MDHLVSPSQILTFLKSVPEKPVQHYPLANTRTLEIKRMGADRFVVHNAHFRRSLFTPSLLISIQGEQIKQVPVPSLIGFNGWVHLIGTLFLFLFFYLNEMERVEALLFAASPTFILVGIQLIQMPYYRVTIYDDLQTVVAQWISQNRTMNTTK